MVQNANTSPLSSLVIGGDRAALDVLKKFAERSNQEARRQLQTLEPGKTARDGGMKVTSLPQAADLVAIILKENHAASILQPRSPLSKALLEPSDTIFSIDGSTLEHPITLAEFNIILSLFQAKGRTNPFWLVAESPKMLESLVKTHPFVRIITPEQYRVELDLLRSGTPFITIGYQDHLNKMGHLDIPIRRPKEGEIVSALSFMSLAVGKDPALEALAAQLGETVRDVQSTLVITPTPTYIQAITTYRQL